MSPVDAAADGGQVTCDFCGSTAAGDHPPITWTVSKERGRVMRYCERCTREHLRSLEGKLDQEYW